MEELLMIYVETSFVKSGCYCTAWEGFFVVVVVVVVVLYSKTDLT